MIIQKLNVSDQMVVKISFVMDRQDLNVDRDFFKNDTQSHIDLNVTLDEVSVIGYMSNFSFGVNNNRTDFYTFEKTENSNIIDQKEIFKQLKLAGIGVNVHYMPIYLHPYYQKLGYTNGLCPIAEEVYDQIISLPLFPLLKNDELEYLQNKKLEHNIFLLEKNKLQNDNQIN